ncbi:MAG: Holliday junction resolvase RuvX [Rickettsiales bacterium]|jgi:putative Holliday junction resolvase|nr:Holliday junction resolvase RuvX [Rickettsiales bacterium]
MIFTDRGDFLNVCSGRLLGIDMGVNNIGIAITDETKTICTPSETIKNDNFFLSLSNIVKSKKITGIVVGIPLNFQDEDTKFSKKIRKTFQNFSKQNDIPIIFQDERLTSFEAENLIGNYKNKKKVLDKIAASYILESFLDL